MNKFLPALAALLPFAAAGPLAPAAAEEAERPLVEKLPSAAESAVRRGLDFLAKGQNSDGSWRNQAGRGIYPTAMTALAGMAFLAAGNTATEGAHADRVRKAVEFLLKKSQSSGLIADASEEAHHMHSHGYAVLFLASALGSCGDPILEKKITEVLKKAIDLTAKAQSPAGGWNYTANRGGDEGSVTITQLQALRACQNAGMQVPKKVIDGAVKYIESSQTPDGGIAYRAGGRHGVGGGRPAITAAAVASLYSSGKYDSAIAKKALEFCQGSIRVDQGGGGARGHYFYAHLYYAQALYQAGDKLFKKYYAEMRDHLVKSQSSDGSWMGDGVGTVYGTAISLIVLQLPYSYVPIYQK